MLVISYNITRVYGVLNKDYGIDNGLDEEDALTYPLFSTSIKVNLS